MAETRTIDGWSSIRCSEAGRHDQRPLGLTLFLIAAAASFLLSTAIWFTDNKDDEAVFVGLWVRRSSRPAALAWSR
ncbi:MAG: hypothetical protein ACRDPL_05820 [Propionibacteriaceae bacterium]